jgi:hypothetical protein
MIPINHRHTHFDDNCFTELVSNLGGIEFRVFRKNSTSQMQFVSLQFRTLSLSLSLSLAHHIHSYVHPSHPCRRIKYTNIFTTTVDGVMRIKNIFRYEYQSSPYTSSYYVYIYIYMFRYNVRHARNNTPRGFVGVVSITLDSHARGPKK